MARESQLDSFHKHYKKNSEELIEKQKIRNRKNAKQRAEYARGYYQGNKEKFPSYKGKDIEPEIVHENSEGFFVKVESVRLPVWEQQQKLLNDQDKKLSLAVCPHDKLKTYYMSYCLFKHRFVSMICEDCFKEVTELGVGVEDIMAVVEISKEAFAMRLNVKR